MYPRFLPADVTDGRGLPKRTRAGRLEPLFVSAAKYRRLLHACSRHPRNRAIIELLLQTGMRLSELARLAVNDIELPARVSRDPDETGTVYVARKTGTCTKTIQKTLGYGSPATTAVYVATAKKAHRKALQDHAL